MSENISIQEGGRIRAFGPVHRLCTTKQDGGMQYWVPESEVPLGTKTVYRNGLYNPADDDKYGYSRFEVDVSDGGTAPGKDSNGNDYTWGKDSSGNLWSTKAPAYITIETPPSKTVYVDGESIDLTGIVIEGN